MEDGKDEISHHWKQKRNFKSHMMVTKMNCSNEHCFLKQYVYNVITSDIF